MPRTEDDAAASARNAAQLYKLAGNQSPERSEFILTSVVGEFRSGKLREDDCAQVGHPLKTAGNTNDAPAAAPGDRIGAIPPPPPPANSPNSGPTR
jgi:hypothetical protein